MTRRDDITRSTRNSILSFGLHLNVRVLETGLIATNLRKRD